MLEQTGGISHPMTSRSPLVNFKLRRILNCNFDHAAWLTSGFRLQSFQDRLGGTQLSWQLRFDLEDGFGFSFCSLTSKSSLLTSLFFDFKFEVLASCFAALFGLDLNGLLLPRRCQLWLSLPLPLHGSLVP